MNTFRAAFIACILFAVVPCHAGTIVGRVHAEGKEGVSSDPNCGGNYDSRAFKFATKVDYAAMHEFVVFIDGPVDIKGPAQPEKTVQVVTRKVSQKKAMFDPHILPVLKGTTVEWPNNDEILHNVFSYSEAQQFDLGLYKAPEMKSVKFSTAGRVDVFCSIHSSMNCVVLVLENPFFATTDGRGMYSIQNVPAGTYQVKAWHERLPPQKLQVVVPEEGEVKLDFTLGIKGLPKI